MYKCTKCKRDFRYPFDLDDNLDPIDGICLPCSSPECYKEGEYTIEDGVVIQHLKPKARDLIEIKESPTINPQQITSNYTECPNGCGMMVKINNGPFGQFYGCSKCSWKQKIKK